MLEGWKEGNSSGSDASVRKKGRLDAKKKKKKSRKK